MSDPGCDVTDGLDPVGVSQLLLEQPLVGDVAKDVNRPDRNACVVTEMATPDCIPVYLTARSDDANVERERSSGEARCIDRGESRFRSSTWIVSAT
ncbi:MAG: hypothetical protein KF785_14100 [Gemmatimonadales bacterium]|nr:hypothetical protein [Gemmatimonadales bacterium]